MDIKAAQPSNIFAFATEQGRTLVYLNYFDMAICLIIAAIVFGLIAMVAIKFRQKPGDAEPVQNLGNVKLELAWTLIPAAILVVLGVLTAIVMHIVSPPVTTQKPDVIVNAHQWWWEFEYPKYGFVTANEFYLPEGVNSLLEIRAADVIHSFWIPDFGQKMDAIPGHPNNLFFKPIKSGVYTGACSEYCGADHSLMRILAKVVPPEQFEEWTKKESKIPDRPTDPVAQKGEEIFMSQTCGQCHSVAGTEAKGKVGPDLSHLSDRDTIGSVLIANNVDNVAAWIINPQKFKPGCHMPKMRLSQEDAHAIAVYLESLK